ncbi:hypothetical protein SADUNF_Sadunf01G0031100 [Salix dunnii]|uniref:Secreted protein n=1 Tax=Salix dunnii TaxID=1413687 RepID=A0A835N9M2_9ROSI|nr:hypothetical protein SADUNF_Sadunf01G0031100 [Salix dunnii]
MLLITPLPLVKLWVVIGVLAPLSPIRDDLCTSLFFTPAASLRISEPLATLLLTPSTSLYILEF